MRKALSLVIILIGMAPAFAQESAKQRLEKSPRQQEWVAAKNGSRSLFTITINLQPEVGK